MKKVVIASILTMSLYAAEDKAPTPSTSQRLDIVVHTQSPSLSDNWSLKAVSKTVTEKAGHTDIDYVGIRNALRLYKSMAGDLTKEPSGNREIHAREVLNKALMLGAPEEDPSPTKAQQFIHELLEDLSSSVNTLQENSSSHTKKLIGLGASTAVSLSGFAAVLLLYFLNTKCPTD